LQKIYLSFLASVQLQAASRAVTIETKVHQACEPIGGAAIADCGESLCSDERELADVPLGKYGLYTNNPEEFEKRMDEIEDSLNKAEYVFDDPQEWIEIDDFMAAMRKEHLWL